MPKSTTTASPQHPSPLEDWRLVRAGPQSTVGYRVPSVRRATTLVSLNSAEDRAHHGLRVSLELELVLVDDQYAGRYVLREITVRDDGLVDPKTRQMRPEYGLTPELIRSLRLADLISDAAMRAAQPVVIDADTGQVTDHPSAMTVTLDQRIALTWLYAKLCGLDTNKTVASEFGFTPAAAAQRIARLRKAGQIPPATGAGRRR